MIAARLETTAAKGRTKSASLGAKSSSFQAFGFIVFLTIVSLLFKIVFFSIDVPPSSSRVIYPSLSVDETAAPSVHEQAEIALAIKTGAGTVYDRIPVILSTYMQHFPLENTVFISDSIVRIGNIETIDVVNGRVDFNDDQFASTNDIDTSGDHLNQLEIKPDINRQGWKNDQFKFFSGFRALRDRHPDASWYVMVDDDTYLHTRNLRDFLANLNASEPLYIGGERIFNGCGIKNGQSSYYFGHGGSGIIVSKAAMHLLQAVSFTCEQKYKSCWAGDIALGICFHDDLKLVMKGAVSLLHGETPYTLAWREWPYDACAKPLTFHHLVPRHHAKLYAIEEAMRSINGGMVTHADVLNGFYRSEKDRNPVSIGGISVHGDGDRILSNVTDSKACLNYALSTEKTLFWSYNLITGDCITGDGYPVHRVQSDFISGVLPGRIRCTIEPK